MWLQRLDPRELARKISEELRGVDLDPVIARVKADVEKLASREFPLLR